MNMLRITCALGLVLSACTADLVPAPGKPGATNDAGTGEGQDAEKDGEVVVTPGEVTCATAPKTSDKKAKIEGASVATIDGFATNVLTRKDNTFDRTLVLGFTAYPNACGYAAAGLAKLGSDGQVLVLHRWKFADEGRPEIGPGTYSDIMDVLSSSLRVGDTCGPRAVGPAMGTLVIQTIDDTHVVGTFTSAGGDTVKFDLPICNPPAGHDGLAAISDKCCAH
jgi:hypothetical protein